jgi:oligoendopeptidase F
MYLLQSATGPRERMALLETQLKGLAGTFFLQTMMADYEIRAHALVEGGKGISAEILTDLWKAVVEDHFGGLIPEDDPYIHSWARIPHLFNSPFYVYQYATCYASAAAIMQQMSSDPENAIPRYLELLKSGGSDYPMEQLRKAGVDLTDPSVVQSVVEEFSQLVDRLESEYTRYLELKKPDSRIRYGSPEGEKAHVP